MAFKRSDNAFMEALAGAPEGEGGLGAEDEWEAVRLRTSLIWFMGASDMGPV